MRFTVTGLEFGYSRRRPVLSIPELTVDAFPLALLGPNGAGKSTLLALAAGRYAPSAGGLSFAADDAPLGPRELRRRTAWVPQETTVLRGFTAREHVAYSGWLAGLGRREAWDRAPEALDTVGLADAAGRPVHTLSGGQRRRLGIAGAVGVRPEVLLLDEPYAGLDPEQRGILRQSLTRLRERTALIVSTHQTESFAAEYGSVVVLSAGRVAFAGSAARFLAGGSTAEAAYLAVLEGQPEAHSST